MDPVTAASLYVGFTLMMPTLVNLKRLWLSTIVYIILVFSEVMLGITLWPFYVLAFFHTIIFIFVVIFTGVKAYVDAKGASNGNETISR